MKQCCYNMKVIGLACHCNEQRGPDTFTAEEIRRYITPTHT